MPEISVEFSAYCACCGAGMCGNVEVDRDSRGAKIIIEPCKRCIENAKEEGHDKGYEEGHADGVASVET